MEKLKMHSPDLTQDNIARIRELFPGCVTEAKAEDGSVKLAVDFDLLRAANKTPWRCCVTLPYCLYCLRSHA